jgi:hypothetical protein
VVVAHGGVKTVVAAMRNHLSDVETQTYGCRILLGLAYDAGHEHVVARDGGVEAVIAAMRTHPEHSDVQYFGCWALMNLSEKM